RANPRKAIFEVVHDRVDGDPGSSDAGATAGFDDQRVRGRAGRQFKGPIENVIVEGRFDRHWKVSPATTSTVIENRKIVDLPLNGRCWNCRCAGRLIASRMQNKTISFIGNLNNDDNPYIQIGDTVVLGNTLVLDLRYGINRINSNNEADTFDNFDYVQFGIPSSLLSLNGAPGAPPQFDPGERYSPLNSSNSLHKRERQTNHMVAASLTKSLGRWTLKLGDTSRPGAGCHIFHGARTRAAMLFGLEFTIKLVADS
ncbi:MAG: hypothetical protein ACREEM_56380, partial [Blastocatellia bacterium]